MHVKRIRGNFNPPPIKKERKKERKKAQHAWSWNTVCWGMKRKTERSFLNKGIRERVLRTLWLQLEGSY